MKKIILFSTALLILLLGCRSEKSIDIVVEQIDLPKIKKEVSASPELIKRNIETTVNVLREESKPKRKLRIFNPTPTPTGRAWPILKRIQKNEPRRIVYETTENTISVAEKTIGNFLDKAFQPTPSPTSIPKMATQFSIKRDSLLNLSDYYDFENLAKNQVKGDVDGLQWGRDLVAENETFYIGKENFEQYWSIGSIEDEVGYFYSSESGYANPEIKFGYVVDGGDNAEGLCGSNLNGYEGYMTHDGNWTSVAWGVYNGIIGPIIDGAFDYNRRGIKDDVYTITFGTRASDCYQGQLLFLQGGKLGIIDPIKITKDGQLYLNWWLVDIDEGVNSINRKRSYDDLIEQTSFFDEFYGPSVLNVQVNDEIHYSGAYEYHSRLNNKPMWVNRECGDIGSEYQYCYIFWYQDIYGARDEYGNLIDEGTWVLQPVLPTFEWLAHSYTDAEWPWGGGWSSNISRISGGK